MQYYGIDHLWLRRLIGMYFRFLKRIIWRFRLCLLCGSFFRVLCWLLFGFILVFITMLSLSLVICCCCWELYFICCCLNALWVSTFGLLFIIVFISSLRFCFSHHCCFISCLRCPHHPSARQLFFFILSSFRIFCDVCCYLGSICGGGLLLGCLRVDGCFLLWGHLGEQAKDRDPIFVWCCLCL